MMIVNKEQITVVLSPEERNNIAGALEDVVARYEAADEHTTNEHYTVLRNFLEALDTTK